jgi:hypothetical protein
MGRRFITRHDIDEHVERGVTEIEVDDAVTVTDLAREHALARGVRIVHVGDTRGAEKRPQGLRGPELRATVRSAVIARLGAEPADLDAVLDRVLDRMP